MSALSVLATAQTAPKLDASCEDVVIFMARGNNAPYHDDRTFPLVQATCDKFAAQGTSCDYIDIQFDVTLGGPYCDQIAEGARNGISEITNFNRKCPNTHIVVNGYSEGSNVVGDVLGGPGGCTGTSTGIDNNSAAGKAIAAALLWGDVRHTANQPYNVLDGASKEKAPRTGRDLQLLNRYTPVLRSYCAAGDPVCAGGNTVDDHLNYFQLYTNDASSWIVSMVNKLKPTASSSSSSSTALPTATSYSNSTASATGPVYPSGTDGGYPTVIASSAPEYPTGPISQPTTPYSTAAPGQNGGHPAFPVPVPYDACVVTYEFEYVYA